MTTTERAIYPGHPLVLALQIVRTYDSWEEASEHPIRPDGKRSEYSRALGSSKIDGAGGNVNAAMRFLRNLHAAPTLAAWTEGQRDADAYWQISVADPVKWREGQEQADALADTLYGLREWWGWTKDAVTLLGELT